MARIVCLMQAYLVADQQRDYQLFSFGIVLHTIKFWQTANEAN